MGQVEIKERYDVVIVGSGPAGAAAARALTGSALRTMIIEQCKLPRYKMCSGILFPRAVSFVATNFGKIPEGILSRRSIVKGIRVYLTLDSPHFEDPFSLFDENEGLPENGLNIERAQLDHWLCSQSDASLIDDCRFEGFEEDDGHYIVQVKYSGEDLKIRARYLVGADGTISRVRKAAFPEFDRQVGLVPNYEEWYIGEIDLEPGWLYVFLDREITGYMATVFHKDDEIIVVTGVKKGESLKEYFRRFRAHLQDRHGLLIKEKTKNHGITLTDMSARRNYCLGKGNVLLAGEAGGFLRGGEGITSSLISGKAAGEAILESFKSGEPAIEHYRRLASEEAETCNKVHQRMETNAGYNMFTRP